MRFKQHTFTFDERKNNMTDNKKQKYYIGAFVDQFMELPDAILCETKAEAEEYASKHFNEMVVVGQNSIVYEIISEQDIVDAFNKDIKDFHEDLE